MEKLAPEKIVNISEGFDRVGSIIKIRGEEDKLFRIINNEYRTFFESMFNSGVLAPFMGTYLVPTIVSGRYSGPNGELVLEHEKIPDINYLFEWSREMTKDAGIFLLDMAAELIRKDLFVKDSHAFNIVFSRKQPIFHDFGSIEANKGTIGAIWLDAFFENFIFPVRYFHMADGKKYREFAISHLDNPFNVWRFLRFSLARDPAYSIRTAAEYFRMKKSARAVASSGQQLEFLRILRAHMAQTEISYPRTKWGDYSADQDPAVLDDRERWDDKKKNFSRLAEKISPESVLDIGGNTGVYTRICRQACPTLKKSILLDYDEVAVDLAYRSKTEADNVYVGDFRLLSRNVSTYFKPYKKTVYPSFASRNAADLTLMLALIHHLVYYQGLDFAEIAATLRYCTQRWLILEFVSNDDFHVQKWFKKGIQKKEWYTQDNLLSELGKYFSVQDILPSGIGREDRRLLLCEKIERGMPAKKPVAVVTTVYQDRLTPDQEISIRHLRAHLGPYDKFALVPAGSGFGLPGFTAMEFPPEYFKGAADNARMLFSKEFYGRFRDYEYVLIYELDALVFSDQMMQWVHKGYDYIGAPWIRSQMPKRYEYPDAVGNGGFALRRIDAFIEALDSAGHPWRCIWRELRLAARRRNISGLIPKMWDIWSNVPSRTKLIEDRWFSFKAKLYNPYFKVAPVEEGIRFAFETGPRYCFERNGRKLPFGAHAWTRYDREFWEPFLLKSD